MTRSVARFILLILTLPMALLVAPLPATAEPTAAPPPSDFVPIYETGAEWAADEYTSAVAFGDIDGDGLDEVAIGRHATTGPRVFVYDDAAAGFAPLWSFGEGWGVASWTTGLAFGNVDDDPAEELAFTRTAAVNERVWVVDDAAAGFVALVRYGDGWPSTVSAIGVALGDVDGDGRDEVAFSRVATINPRVFVHDDAAPGGSRAAFGLLWGGGSEWPGGYYATAVAFGNVDKAPEKELGLARLANEGPRAYVLRRGWVGWLPLVSDGTK